MARFIYVIALALPLGIGIGDAGVEAACRWTQRAEMPYIACDAAPAGLRPPETVSRERVSVPDVLPAPLPENPQQPPIAGTPATPLAPAPSLNLRPPPGLLNPPGGSGVRPKPSLAR